VRLSDRKMRRFAEPHYTHIGNAVSPLIGFGNSISNLISINYLFIIYGVTLLSINETKSPTV
jgi:hypothetical protein